MGRLNVKVFSVFREIRGTQKQLTTGKEIIPVVELNSMLTKILIAQVKLNSNLEKLENKVSKVIGIGATINLVDEQLDRE